MNNNEVNKGNGLRPVGTGIAMEAPAHLEEIEREIRGAVRDLLAVAALEAGDALVVGCSSSEVASSAARMSLWREGELIISVGSKPAINKDVEYAEGDDNDNQGSE